MTDRRAIGPDRVIEFAFCKIGVSEIMIGPRELLFALIDRCSQFVRKTNA